MDKFKEDLIRFIKEYEPEKEKSISVKVQHNFGNPTETKYLAVDIVKKITIKGSPQIHYMLNGDRKIFQYYYDSSKFENDEGFMWGLKLCHFYLIKTIKYQPSNKWVWEDAWLLPHEKFIEFYPPIQSTEPKILIETLEKFNGNN